MNKYELAILWYFYDTFIHAIPTAFLMTILQQIEAM